MIMATDYRTVNKAEQARNLAILRDEAERASQPQQGNAGGWIALALIGGTILLGLAVIAVPELLIPIGALLAVGLVVLGIGLARAPEGYEDRDGFHYGKKGK
jgi:cobalamin biosynthesis protein CobD/CbiB